VKVAERLEEAVMVFRIVERKQMVQCKLQLTVILLSVWYRVAIPLNNLSTYETFRGQSVFKYN